MEGVGLTGGLNWLTPISPPTDTHTLITVRVHLAKQLHHTPTQFQYCGGERPRCPRGSDAFGFKPFLLARRYASAGYSDRNVSVRPSVRPSVCPSVTRRYCVKTNKASGMISSKSGSPKTLVF